jgi:hypothetical protein
MKKTIISLCVSTVLLMACHKDHTNSQNPAQPTIIGKWNIDTVTTYFYDSTGLREKGVHSYPVGAPDYPYHLQFNTDHSFIEDMHSPSNPSYIVTNGTYSLTSDSTFTLIYPTAVAGKEVEPCKIVLLSNTSFVFSKQLTTVFNGTEPGYIKYVYQLTRL